jgi:hypothetical protein
MPHAPVTNKAICLKTKKLNKSKIRVGNLVTCNVLYTLKMEDSEPGLR